MLLVNNYLLKEFFFFRISAKFRNIQTSILNRIHKDMCSLSDLSSSKNAEDIGISWITHKSLKYKTKRMNTCITRDAT